MRKAVFVLSIISLSIIGNTLAPDHTTQAPNNAWEDLSLAAGGLRSRLEPVQYATLDRLASNIADGQDSLENLSPPERALVLVRLFERNPRAWSALPNIEKQNFLKDYAPDLIQHFPKWTPKFSFGQGIRSLDDWIAYGIDNIGEGAMGIFSGAVRELRSAMNTDPDVELHFWQGLYPDKTLEDLKELVGFDKIQKKHTETEADIAADHEAMNNWLKQYTKTDRTQGWTQRTELLSALGAGIGLIVTLFVLLAVTKLHTRRNSLMEQGDEKMKRGNYNEAIRLYKAATKYSYGRLPEELKGKVSHAYYKYGLEYFRNKNYIESIKCFKKAWAESQYTTDAADIYKQHLHQAETALREQKEQKQREEREREEQRQERKGKEAWEQGIWLWRTSTGGEVDITKPEEQVRQKYIRKLVEDYGYAIENISIEVPIQIGSDNRRCDIAIFDGRNIIVGIVETKSWNTKLNQGHKGQLESYMSATPTCKWGVLTNGDEESCGHRNFTTGKINWDKKVPRRPIRKPETKSIGQTKKSKDTDLLEAAKVGNVRAIQELLKAGTDIEAKNEVGTTALMNAAWQGHSEAVRILLKAGANIEARTKDDETALIVAAWYGHVEAIQELLKAGANIEAKDGYEETALISATVRGHSDTIRVLLKAGADTEAKDIDGWTSFDTWQKEHKDHTHFQEISDLLRPAKN